MTQSRRALMMRTPTKRTSDYTKIKYSRVLMTSEFAQPGSPWEMRPMHLETLLQCTNALEAASKPFLLYFRVAEGCPAVDSAALRGILVSEVECCNTQSLGVPNLQANST